MNRSGSTLPLIRSAAFVIALVLCAGSFLPRHVGAQDSRKGVLSPFRTGEISLGVHLGGRLSAFYGPDASPSQLGSRTPYQYQRTESRRTYGVGLRASQKWSSRWSLRIGVSLVGRGESLEGLSGGRRVSTVVKLTYIDLPLSIQYTPFRADALGKTVRAYLFAGPTASILLRNRTVQTIGENESSSSSGQNFRSFIPGAHLGIGTEAALPTGQIAVEFSYDVGLRKITTTNIDLRNHGIGIALVYAVSL